MSLEQDVTQIKTLVEAKPIFKAASKAQMQKRREEMDKNVNKAEVVRLVNRALEAQFSGYSWSDMLRDGLIDCNDAERAWAEENLSYKVTCDDPTYLIEADVFKPASPANVAKREEIAKKEREARLADRKGVIDICPNPNCKADLREDGVYESGMESYTQNIYWDERRQCWEWGERDNGDSDHDSFNCSKCGGDLIHETHFDIEGDL